MTEPSVLVPTTPDRLLLEACSGRRLRLVDRTLITSVPEVREPADRTGG